MQTLQVTLDLTVRCDYDAARKEIEEKIRRAIESVTNPHRTDQGVCRIERIACNFR